MVVAAVPLEPVLPLPPASRKPQVVRDKRTRFLDRALHMRQVVQVVIVAIAQTDLMVQRTEVMAVEVATVTRLQTEAPEVQVS